MRAILRKVKDEDRDVYRAELQKALPIARAKFGPPMAAMIMLVNTYHDKQVEYIMEADTDIPLQIPAILYWHHRQNFKENQEVLFCHPHEPGAKARQWQTGKLIGPDDDDDAPLCGLKCMRFPKWWQWKVKTGEELEGLEVIKVPILWMRPRLGCDEENGRSTPFFAQ